MSAPLATQWGNQAEAPLCLPLPKTTSEIPTKNTRVFCLEKLGMRASRQRMINLELHFRSHGKSVGGGGPWDSTTAVCLTHRRLWLVSNLKLTHTTSDITSLKVRWWFEVGRKRLLVVVITLFGGWFLVDGGGLRRQIMKNLSYIKNGKLFLVNQ